MKSIVFNKYMDIMSVAARSSSAWISIFKESSNDCQQHTNQFQEITIRFINLKVTHVSNTFGMECHIAQ